ncbi:MAG: FAD-dependent oxidoreductase [Saprospiraceae bacterium]|nr:FAD-dependent oxidoreductase [Saprospiraceae bacterium]
MDKSLTADGSTFTAHKILFATESTGLIHQYQPDLNTDFCSTVNLYFTAATSPVRQPILLLNTKKSLVNNVTVLSDVADTYSASGNALISVTIVGINNDEISTLTQKVKTELTTWFGKAVESWELLKTYPVQYALPKVPSARHELPSIEFKIKENWYQCGDHLLYGSLNAAMRSGRLAAELIVREG